MHPCFELSNLARLSLSLRMRARAALSGSADESKMLVNDLPDIAPQFRPFLLPVFYGILDLARIPEILNQLDSESSMDFDAIQNQILEMLMILRGIMQLGDFGDIPSAAFMDLWMRVGPWIFFLDEYRDHLPGLDLLPAPAGYTLFLSLFRLLRGNTEVAQLMDTTPASLCVVVGRAWYQIVHAEDRERLQNVSYFLGLWSRDPDEIAAVFEGLVSGAGGASTDFASLVASHLNFVLPSADSTITPETLYHLIGVFPFDCNAAKTAGKLFCDTAFQEALLSHGVVTALTITSLAVSRCNLTLKAVPSLVHGYFGALVAHLSSFPCHRWIVESLRAGLFPAVLSCGTPKHATTRITWHNLLRDVLPAPTVYHSVLSQLRVSLMEVRAQDVAAISADTDLVARWTTLLKLVESRVQIMDKYDTGLLTAARACDSITCAKICAKNGLKRCGGCSFAYYCSRLCQTDDWRNGHRRACVALSSRHYKHSHISAKDGSFLRALLHHDYTTRRKDIAMAV
ncbi:hypothetical protein K438DRAFT_2013906 [Mycena galopus ATCC 62051]|nr:hypothetical protein K438DRAFT_2013906 [Mycena galopus ATCC 62051]